ncbi:MAG: hypothetical protein GY925_01945 [Actinomycetia bacterium]|nr:hypothetical protein [Actinomycetes bacterium]
MDRLTQDRLSSYLAATAGDVRAAVELYDWNTQVGAALYEDLGRLEVIFRNAIDASLVAHGQTRAWSQVWYRRQQLFAGRPGRRAWGDIEAARRRATRRGRPEVHGQVVAELSFGFWRFLCTSHYLTSLWVPALATAFPGHPDAGDPRLVRADVDDRVQRLHFLRDRIAHHEPIHQRNLQRDHEEYLDVIGWICADSLTWVSSASRTLTVIGDRP